MKHLKTFGDSKFMKDDIVELRWASTGERNKGKVTGVEPDGTLIISNLDEEDEELEYEFTPDKNKEGIYYEVNNSFDPIKITLKARK